MIIEIKNEMNTAEEERRTRKKKEQKLKENIMESMTGIHAINLYLHLCIVCVYVCIIAL